MSEEPLARRVLRGDTRAVARAITVVEGDPAGAETLLTGLLGQGGTAHRVGVTGPPGAGKSTLVSSLAAHWRSAGRRVGVLAVDPSSPFSGGALLGDRVRMGRHSGDADVFIRSFASRGQLGGLSAAVEDAADVLDAAGFDPVVFETVGVGQAEWAVASAADTTVLVLAPGGGDEVQAMKAGILEAADLVVVNQSDRPEADRLVRALETAFELRHDRRPPIFRTTATTGEGVEALAEAVDARAAADTDTLAARRLDRSRRRIRARVDDAVRRAFWAEHEEGLEAWALKVRDGLVTPAGAARALVEGGER